MESNTEKIFMITKNTQVPGVKKQIKINPSDNFVKILALIGSKLEIEAKILYNDLGAVIEDGNDIRDNEVVYVSQGEQFWPKNSGVVEGIQSNKKVLKLGIIGPASVGKSALSIRYVQKIFIDEYLPSFENLFKKETLIRDQHVEIDILDTSGLEELVVMRPAWCKEREGFFLVYAINDRRSFDELRVFHDQLLTFRQGVTPAIPPIIVVGNKSDMELERKVKKEDGIKLAKSWEVDFYETSAKRDINVNTIFEELAKKVYDIKYPAPVNDREEKKCSCITI